ncbi:MAG: ACP S-malonyltransferase [Saprospiraceae bacterium]
MKRALIFPGQAAQFEGMGRLLVESHVHLNDILDHANDILGFDIRSIMFDGSAEDLKRTDVTQPAVFIHSYMMLKSRKAVEFEATAGHSLGEITALVAADVLSFEEGLGLVKTRSELMQEACKATNGSMAAIIGLEDETVEKICNEVDGIVVAANYNCPGQLVISGDMDALQIATSKMTEAGARRAIILNVGGAFHSALMSSASKGLAAAINAINFQAPKCAIYQNVDAKPNTDPELIKANLIAQLDSPVRWAQIIQNMITSGIEEFIEVGGKGNILNGMIRRIDRSAKIEAWKE